MLNFTLSLVARATVYQTKTSSVSPIIHQTSNAFPKISQTRGSTDLDNKRAIHTLEYRNSTISSLARYLDPHRLCAPGTSFETLHFPHDSPRRVSAYPCLEAGHSAHNDHIQPENWEIFSRVQNRIPKTQHTDFLIAAYRRFLSPDLHSSRLEPHLSSDSGPASDPPSFLSSPSKSSHSNRDNATTKITPLFRVREGRYHSGDR